MTSPRKPAFFIVGAPKSGTTALDSYLSTHPDLFLAKKESHHFAQDLITHHNNYYKRADYLKLFEKASPTETAGESSVLYLFSKKAAQAIHDFNPNARIIIMLRNPVTQIPSMHSQCIFGGEEDEMDLATALGLEEKRSLICQQPQHTKQIPQNRLYTQIASYPEQIKRYLDIFPSEQIRCILFEDFITDTAQAYKETLAFLGVSQEHTPLNFNVVNTNKQPRSRLLARALASPPEALRTLMPKSLRLFIHAQCSKLNRKEVPRQTIPSELSAELRKQFSPDITRLENMVNLNFSKWKK